MSPSQKRLLLAALAAAAVATALYLWWNAPVRAATRALLTLVDTLKIEGSESNLARQGKAARLARAISDPIHILFQEAGRDGAWGAEILQARYASAALSAQSLSIELQNLQAEKSSPSLVTIDATLKASYRSSSQPKDIDRPCRWIMEKQGGKWLLTSFKESSIPTHPTPPQP